MKNTWIKETVEWIVCFIIAYAIYLVINYFIGTIAGVKQSSMYPTCHEGDRVVIGRRILYNKTLKRGDIVIVESPTVTENNTNTIATYDEKTGFAKFAYSVIGIGKMSYIKRVIGLPGEHLFISEDGYVYINGEKLDESYLPEGTITPRLGAVYDVQIPEGYVFCIGDNRAGSMDCRMFGAVPMNKVEGKVIGRIWPLNKLGNIDK